MSREMRADDLVPAVHGSVIALLARTVPHLAHALAGEPVSVLVRHEKVIRAQLTGYEPAFEVDVARALLIEWAAKRTREDLWAEKPRADRRDGVPRIA